MGLLCSLKAAYLSRKAQAHRKALDRVAVIGEGFCESVALGAASILRVRINNRIGDPDRVRIGRFCNMGASILCDGNGSVTIGDFVYFNSGAVLRVAHGVRIGSHCMFGPDVIIWDTDNHPLSRCQRHLQAEVIPVSRISPYEANGGPITIGSDVWVCMGALILGGVRIGDGAIVAARSVVTHDVAPMTIVAGCPARLIGPVPD